MGSADLSFAGLRHLPLGTSRKPQTSRKPGVPAAHLALPVCSGHRLMFPQSGQALHLIGRRLSGHRILANVCSSPLVGEIRATSG